MRGDPISRAIARRYMRPSVGATYLNTYNFTEITITTLSLIMILDRMYPFLRRLYVTGHAQAATRVAIAF